LVGSFTQELGYARTLPNTHLHWVLLVHCSSNQVLNDLALLSGRAAGPPLIDGKQARARAVPPAPEWAFIVRSLVRVVQVVEHPVYVMHDRVGRWCVGAAGVAKAHLPRIRVACHPR
jgi:hypothetical protein